jgi:hypothetical protein
MRRLRNLVRQIAPGTTPPFEGRQIRRVDSPHQKRWPEQARRERIVSPMRRLARAASISVTLCGAGAGDARLGEPAHVGRELDADDPASRANGGDEKRKRQSRAAGHVENRVAGRKPERRDGSAAKLHGAHREGVVRLRGRGNARSRGPDRRPSSPKLQRTQTASSSRTRSITLPQSPGDGWRKRRAVGYHGLSRRSSIQRQS